MVACMETPPEHLMCLNIFARRGTTARHGKLHGFNFCHLLATESTQRLSMRRTAKSSLQNRAWANSASWLRNRRRAVKKAVSSQSGKGRDVSRVAASMWTDSHDKERAFIKKKEHGKRSLAQVEPAWIAMAFEGWAKVSRPLRRV